MEAETMTLMFIIYDYTVYSLLLWLTYLLLYAQPLARYSVDELWALFSSSVKVDEHNLFTRVLGGGMK